MTSLFHASQLPRQPGPAAWNSLLPARPISAPLEGHESADIAVIGAGFAGLSAARRLSQFDPAVKVAVVEAGCVAEGPAGRNSGFMIDLPHDLSSSDYAGLGDGDDRLQIELNRLAIGFAAQVAEESGLDTGDFDPCGKINAAATNAGHRHNLSYAAHLEQLGENCAPLDASQMRQITGTDYYRSGLFTPGTVMLQPAAYIRGLARVLGSNVTLFEQSPVNTIGRDKYGWVLSCGEARLSAPKIILATNGHAESFGFFSGRLMHVFTYASMSEPLAAETATQLGGKDKWAITPSDPMGATLRRISTPEGSRIVIRSRFTYNPSMCAGRSQLQSASISHDRGFRSRFPQLAGIKMQYRWGGQLCLSRNAAPAFGEIEDGIFAACCQNGLGAARGTLSGMAAAELALGQPGKAADGLSNGPGPSKLPPKALTWIGANLMLRWKEWAAGREC